MQSPREFRERIARYRQLMTQLSDERAVRALGELCADYEARIATAEREGGADAVAQATGPR